ncbi:MFS transporter [Henriciella aquimarina]|uniref:MFS transporter n=1 Tax=Henriciella aquimarina TaxID=545261 RepID=UPI000A030521|nr:MFS transporter [Henriciella aquimarina]
MLSFLRTNIRWIAGGFLLTFFSSFGQTFFIGVSGGELREKFSLTDGEFGLTYMIATLASALTLPWLGRTLDHMAGRRVVQFVIPSLAAACLLIAFAPNVIIVVLALYMLRLFGQGMMTHTALTETGRWFSANRGRATSLVVPGVQAGTALLPLVFTLLAAALGWQTAWGLAALTLIVFALPAISFLWAVERSPQADQAPGQAGYTARNWTVREVLKDPVFYLLIVCVLAPPFIGTTIFFHQDYLVELRGYADYAFASAFPLMGGTTVIFALVCGHLIDRFGAARLLPFFLLPLATASAVTALLTPLWGIYAFMVLMGISNGFTQTLVGALWPEVYGTKHLGSIRSVVVAFMVMSTSLGPGLSGALIDLGIELPVQLLWMAGWCLVACLALGLIAPVLVRRKLAGTPAS